DDSVQQVGCAEPHSDRRGGRTIVVGDDVGDTARDRACAPTAERLDEESGFDADRTSGCAQSARCTGCDAVLVVEIAHDRELLRVLVAAFEARDLPPADDPLAWRQREPVRRALDLAEAAL